MKIVFSEPEWISMNVISKLGRQPRSSFRVACKAPLRVNHERSPRDPAEEQATACMGEDRMNESLDTTI